MLKELFRDRGRFFWVLNVAGWSGYVLTAYLGALAHEKPDSYIAVIVAIAFLGFLLTIPMRLLYRRLWQRSPVAIAVGIIVTCYLLALGWRWFSNTLYFDWVKSAWQPEYLADYVSGVMGSFYILMRTGTLVENRGVAAGRPAAPHQGGHQQPRFVDKHRPCPQARSVFFTRGQASLAQRWMACSSRSMARRAGFCGFQPKLCSKRPI